MVWLAVAVGGALGSMARHGVNVLFSHRLLRVEPFGTAAVNVIGSAIIGVLAGLIAGGKLHLSMPMRTFVFVGVLGGFTTFSSLMLDTVAFVDGHQTPSAMFNIALQLVLGFAAAYAGFKLAA